MMRAEVETTERVDLLTADDIAWTSPPVPRSETLDLHQLSVRELVIYVHDLRQDLALLREVLSEALTRLHRSTGQNQQYQVRLRAVVRDRLTRNQGTGARP